MTHYATGKSSFHVGCLGTTLSAEVPEAIENLSTTFGGYAVERSLAYPPTLNQFCEIENLRRTGGDGPRSEIGFVYFVAPAEGHDPIKIGFTRVPVRRLQNYICHSPFSLVLLGLAHSPLAVERELHNRFERDRLHGEWFRRSSELLSLIDKHRYVPGDDIFPIKAL